MTALSCVSNLTIANSNPAGRLTLTTVPNASHAARTASADGPLGSAGNGAMQIGLSFWRKYQLSSLSVSLHSLCQPNGVLYCAYIGESFRSRKPLPTRSASGQSVFGSSLRDMAGGGGGGVTRSARAAGVGARVQCGDGSRRDAHERSRERFSWTPIRLLRSFQDFLAREIRSCPLPRSYRGTRGRCSPRTFSRGGQSSRAAAAAAFLAPAHRRPGDSRTRGGPPR